MMYLSSAGEHKSNEIKPIRKTAILVLVGLVITVFALIKFIGSFGSPDVTTAETTRPAVGAGTGAGSRASTPSIVLSSPPPRHGQYSSLSGLRAPDVIRQPYVQVSLSGAWVGDRMIAVDLFGDVIPLADLPYSYSIDKARRKAVVAIPDEALASLRPGVWVDNSRVLSTGSRASVDDAKVPASTAPAFGQVTPDKS